MEWVAISSSMGSSQPWDRTCISCLAAQFFPTEPQYKVSVQFSSVQSLSRVRLFATPWIAARQASPSITNSPSSLRLTSIESVMPSSHRILCRPLLLLPPIPPSTRVFSSESVLRTNYSLSPSKYIWRAVVSMGQSPKSRNTGVISCSLIISFQLFIP